MPRSSLTRVRSFFLTTTAPVLAGTLAALGPSAISLGQCTGQWSNAFPGLTAGPVKAMTLWDPDGAGPLPPVLVIGGDANLAGGPGSHNVLYWNTTTSAWQPLGSGMMNGASIGGVRALIVYNGDLIAAGIFTSAGGIAANYIARWSGTIAGGSWQPLGSGLGGGGNGGNTLAVYGTDLIVGGNFLTAGGVTGVGEIARWDGAAWHAMNNGFNTAVNTVASYGGRVYASGGFSAAVGGNFLSGIGSWSSPAGPWISPGAGLAGVGYAMTEYNGELIVGGTQVAFAGSSVPIGVVRWNGSAWGVLGGGITYGDVNALTVYNDGGGGGGPNLIAGGTFITAGGSPGDRIARWNGSNWQPMGTGMNADVNALTVYNGQLVAAGNFHLAGGVPVNFIASFTSANPCPADFNCSGTLEVADIFAFINGWFAGVPAADFDGMNGLQVADIFAFLNAWFSGC